jgi:hypothetical protein
MRNVCFSIMYHTYRLCWCWRLLPIYEKLLDFHLKTNRTSQNTLCTLPITPSASTTTTIAQSKIIIPFNGSRVQKIYIYKLKYAEYQLTDFNWILTKFHLSSSRKLRIFYFFFLRVTLRIVLTPKKNETIISLCGHWTGWLNKGKLWKNSGFTYKCVCLARLWIN